MSTITKMAQVADVLDHLEAPIDQKLAAIEALLSHFTLAMEPLVLSYKTYSADAVADMTKTLHLLGTGVDVTAMSPAYIGQVIIVVCTDSTTNATATCGVGCTWEGTNDRATFPDSEDTIVAYALSLTRWHILINLTGVTFD